MNQAINKFMVATRHEIFHGEETGATDITALTAWIKSIGRKPQPMGFEEWNCRELLESHDWDETMEKRINSLYDLIDKTHDVEPLILLMSEKISNEGASYGFENSGFIIDGWHRLAIIYKHLTGRDKNVKKIPFMAYLVTQAECDKFPVLTALMNRG